MITPIVPARYRLDNFTLGVPTEYDRRNYDRSRFSDLIPGRRFSMEAALPPLPLPAIAALSGTTTNCVVLLSERTRGKMTAS
ncbi:hypothetical protein GWI33_021842 [Rhynchophorus ferrugineus]|uniref:Uncharacterized protein n=1 Tax=Rhynchophorus ferrugineus TaxID=354439 RepID=A0A834MJF5_RHYFE|nr:hypothetical protein GWI33_021842 [Rhynchophorus ferrugineus]